MEELELKHIQHYDLETLRFITPTSNKKRQIASINPIMGYIQDTENESWSFKYIKPILRPMSDLYKPLEDGTIPIVELAKIATNNTDGWTLFNSIASNVDKGMNFYWNTITKGFDLGSIANFSLNQMTNQLQLFEYLFKHHFNVFELSDELIVDINTIEKV